MGVNRGGGGKGVARTWIKLGVRQGIVCKDGNGKIGLRVQAFRNVKKMGVLKLEDGWINRGGGEKM